MVKTYQHIGVFPLEFPEGQEVELGETFQRDFEKTSGTNHELWLTQLGHIREVVPTEKVTKQASGSPAPAPMTGDTK